MFTITSDISESKSESKIVIGENDTINDTTVKCVSITDIADQLQLENIHLREHNNSLLKRIEELETRLKKYTNGDNHKRYYEKNKNKIKETGTAYLQKLKTENPDKLKEYSHNAYQRKKLKKQQEEEEKKKLADTILCGELPIS
jgi:hypothetical protein